MKVLAVLVSLVSLVDCQNFTSPLRKSFDFNCPANHTIKRMTTFIKQKDTGIKIWCKFEKSTLKCALTDYMGHYVNPLNFTCPRGEVWSGMKSDYIDKLNKRKFKFYCCEVKNSKYFNCYNTPYQDSKEVKLKEGQVIERTRWYYETKNITKRHFRVCEVSQRHTNLNRLKAKCNVTDIDHGNELSGQQRICVISQIKTLSKKTKNLTETINSVADYMEYLVQHGFKISENITKYIVDIFSAFRSRTSDSDFSAFRNRTSDSDFSAFRNRTSDSDFSAFRNRTSDSDFSAFRNRTSDSDFSAFRNRTSDSDFSAFRNRTSDSDFSAFRNRTSDSDFSAFRNRTSDSDFSAFRNRTSDSDFSAFRNRTSDSDFSAFRNRTSDSDFSAFRNRTSDSDFSAFRNRTSDSDFSAFRNRTSDSDFSAFRNRTSDSDFSAFRNRTSDSDFSAFRNRTSDSDFSAFRNRTSDSDFSAFRNRTSDSDFSAFRNRTSDSDFSAFRNRTSDSDFSAFRNRTSDSDFSAFRNRTSDSDFSAFRNRTSDSDFSAFRNRTSDSDFSAFRNRTSDSDFSAFRNRTSDSDFSAFRNRTSDSDFSAFRNRTSDSDFSAFRNRTSDSDFSAFRNRTSDSDFSAFRNRTSDSDFSAFRNRTSDSDFSAFRNRTSDSDFSAFRNRTSDSDFSAFRNRTSDSDFSVDTTTFNQLVTLADIVTISMQDDLTDTPDQDYETTNSIVTSLESVVYALSNQTKDFVSIKNTVGVKLGTITQDIRIPEVNQSASKPFDNWIHMSRYTIIVIKRGEHNATDCSQMNRSSIMSKPKIVSDVIAVSVGHSVTLKSPVTLTFGISNVTQFYMAPVKIVCVYLEMSLSGSVVWTDKGCFTEKSSDDQIICKCYHLTSFAVLMGSKQLPQHQVLTVLTITGCGVSIVCLSITTVVYLYLWKYVKSERSVLLINICVCMLISYLVFLVGIDKTDHQILCQLIAIFLHYSFLCVFFNFLTQSLALYKSIFNKSGRVRLEMFLPVTYITPLLIVGATALVNKAEGYGTSNFCWLSVNKGFIWSFLGPVILILLVNAAVLIAIIKTVQSTHSILDKTHAERTMSAARTIVVLTPMFGLTWVFGLVSMVFDLIVFQYLFVVLNTLQGLFIFLFYCLRQRQVIQAIQLLRRQRQAQTIETTNKRSTTSTSL
nr:adhesion G protein-coupled receptor E2-like [Biomphalaria glabrata]